MAERTKSFAVHSAGDIRGMRQAGASPGFFVCPKNFTASAATIAMAGKVIRNRPGSIRVVTFFMKYALSSWLVNVFAPYTTSETSVQSLHPARRDDTTMPTITATSMSAMARSGNKASAPSAGAASPREDAGRSNALPAANKTA